jgi:hypothetical protein
MMLMNADDFNAYWDATFPLCPPIGYFLRDAYPERWFRIHTLPDSQRYPETPAESAEILRRHTTILAQVFSPGHLVCMLALGYSSTPHPVPPEDLDPRDHAFVFLRTIPMHAADEDERFHRYWHIWLHAYPWHPDSLDHVLSQVADGSIANLVLVAPHQDIIYHPYDGGADVIVPTQAERDRWRTTYRTWLSRHPSGL